MKSVSNVLPLLALLVSLATVGTWLVTGRHYYTKFEVVEQVRTSPADDDPLAGTGFYDDGGVETTQRREEFHLGLIPTPQGLLDKHILSVASILGPTWALPLILFWARNRRRNQYVHSHQPVNPIPKS